MKASKKAIKSSPKKLTLANPTNNDANSYDSDFFNWTKKQAVFLKTGQFTKLDLENLREEIESLGRRDKRSLRSHTIILLIHLLKQRFQPEGKGNSFSWKSSITNAAIEIELVLEDSPSLRNELIKMYSKCYQTAKQQAAIETKLNTDTFPEKCPWTIEEVLPFLQRKKSKLSK